MANEVDLEKLIAEIVDTMVGSSYHDLESYGLTPEQAEEAAQISKAYWARVQQTKLDGCSNEQT